MFTNEVDFAGGLRAVLKERGMKLVTLAALLNINPRQLNTQLVRNNVLLSTVSRVAFVLDMSASELVAAAERSAKEKQVAQTQVAAHTAQNHTTKGSKNENDSDEPPA